MSSQKFISRNRAPRVQIEYDVHVDGAARKVELPFVMGVMADLSGNDGATQPEIAQRKFLEVSADNLDERMKGVGVGVKMRVANTLTGEGNMDVKLTFEKMEDFSPAAIARKVPALQQLLEARTQLAHLLAFMDGKSKAEELVAKLLKDPQALKALSGTEAARKAQEDA